MFFLFYVKHTVPLLYTYDITFPETDDDDGEMLVMMILPCYSHSYGHLLVITGSFYGIIHSIHGVIYI